MNAIPDIVLEASASGRLTRASRERVYQARLEIVRSGWLAGLSDQVIAGMCNSLPMAMLRPKDVPMVARIVLKLPERIDCVPGTDVAVSDPVVPERSLLAVVERDLPGLVITGKDGFKRTAMAPTAVISNERSRAIERLTSLRVLGPAATCQTVLDPGRYGFGIVFCGLPSKKGPHGERKYSYCEACCERHFAKPYGSYSDRAMRSALRIS